MLAAMAAFIAGWPLVSGLCLAFAGVFHINYLVLGLVVFGVSWLLTGRKRLLPRAAAGLGLPLLVLLRFVPFLLAGASPGVSAQARHIYLDIVAPHHCRVRDFAWSFSFWAGFQLLAAAAPLNAQKQGELELAEKSRRAAMLLIGFWVLVVPAVLLSSLLTIPMVRQLFAWRVCAPAELLAQAAFAKILVDVFCEGRRALANSDRRARALCAVGTALFVVGSLATGKWTITLVVLCLLAVAVAISKGILNSKSEGLSLERVTGALLIALVAVNVARFSRLRHYSNLLSGGDPGLTELCSWEIAHTRENDLFLTPPREDDLRFQCRRSIVIDWKAPALPDEILAWYDRLEDVMGGRPFRTDADLAGYDQMTPAQAYALRDKYGPDYVIVKRGHELALGVAPVFTGLRFVVYSFKPRRG